jgi:DNA invertase Pin-like site-specific DNA recombinase
MTTAKKIVRCAIYTRVSTDQGLEQDFNSLDAQYEAAKAYIRSQASEGWSVIRQRYDDGGYSGGSTDRPALQRLLHDIKGGKIDVIVVYKVDRLTRSLADFAKLVELFDAHNVSFVSVTQQFNTTTSMGRLTLNVLLSFAQFEREVTAERIRDKIAASKRRGLWVGGMVPLGYDSRDRKITVNQEEAERVRTIFRRYLELGALGPLLKDLRARGIVTKVRRLSNGTDIGGIPFTRGPLAHLLRNRFYVSEILYKDHVYPGEQPAILDRDLFEKVQAKLTAQRMSVAETQSSSPALLAGRIFDDRGNRMTPTHVTKRGMRYRYYISAALMNGRAERAGAIRRVPGAKIEQAVTKAVRAQLGSSAPTSDSEFIATYVKRVDVIAGQLRIALVNTTELLLVSWSKPSKPRRELIAPMTKRSDDRPIRSETRASLIRAIARGRFWLDELVKGDVRVEDIADRESCSVRHVTMTLSLAFLSPRLVTAAVEGRLPRGIGITRLVDSPAEWSRQFEMLGLSSTSSG